MARRTDRQHLIDEVTRLQEQQLMTGQETALHRYTPEESFRAFDTRFNRIASLMHRLADLDEAEPKYLHKL